MDPYVSLKQQKKSTFLSIRESLRREKFYFGRFAKVYAREMQKFREFFVSRKFMLAKVSAPKVEEVDFGRILVWLFITGYSSQSHWIFLLRTFLTLLKSKCNI